MDLNKILEDVSKELNLKTENVKAVLDMLQDDKTVAFIARYRKELTGGLDESQIRNIEEIYSYNCNLEKKKEDIIRLISEKGLMNEQLLKDINDAKKLSTLDDLYRPFKEKKKTKATLAISLGLTELAKQMMFRINGDKAKIVQPYLSDEVKDYDTAIMHAKYIIAEMISDDAKIREQIRTRAYKYSRISTKKKNNDNDKEEKYLNYYETSTHILQFKPHRFLAINRASSEDVISVSIDLDTLNDIKNVVGAVVKKRPLLFLDDVVDACNDSYKRLIAPSIEREVYQSLLDKAMTQAIEVFSLNLKNLLMQPALKAKVILGVDPAYRTGCKLAVVDEASKVLAIDVIYPNQKSVNSTVSDAQLLKSKKVIVDLVKKYKVSIIVIGNGTASRETTSFIADTIKENKLDCKYAVVSEAGASVYSASELAISEFPDLSVEQRSAISIARRTIDPLAELVKIDPKSIGVGQYQHDVNEAKLSKSLNDVVVDAVNRVGVNLNTASASLLFYVSGLNKTISNNIVKYREENGLFKNRSQLKKVSKLGPKTYEQCVGFLRIFEGDNPLDSTSIHPESYDKANMLLNKLNLSVKSLGSKEVKESVENLDKMAIMKELEIDSYTLNDILDSFVAPLRDIRDEYDGLILRDDIMKFEDIKVGDELDGTVRNVVDFGAFVDCGVKYDGLVHVSKMSRSKISHPKELLSVGDHIKVYVIDIDYNKHKLALSMVKE